MVTSHTQSLDLTALSSDVEYALPLENTAKRCLIHVKLTESCSKAIENLITSNRGAVFSLWFTDQGGHLTLPSSNGAHTFQFSTAAPNKREQNSTLECFHQHTTQERQQQLSMIGRLEHKLTVKATDDVYEETKKKAKLLEEERQGVRTKEIKIPKVGKPKISTRPVHKQFDTSIANRSPFTASGLGRGGGGAGGVANNKAPHSSNAGRAQQKSLKERVIRILAVRPCRRADVVLKLKKATKKSESFFSNLDSVLNEVANYQDSVYHLKDHFFMELDVDSWPFYSEAERDLVRRKLKTSSANSSDSVSGTIPSTKRLGDDSIVSDHAPPKRSKTDSNATITGGISTATPSSTFRQPKPSTQSSTIEPRLRPPDIKPEPTTDKSSLSSKFLSSRYISESNQKPAEVDVSTQEKKKDVSNVYLHVQENSVKKEEIDGNEEKMEVVEKEMEEEKSRKHKKKKKKKHKHEEKDPILPVPDTSEVVDLMIVNYEEPSHHDITEPPLTVESSSNGESAGLPDFERLYPEITSSQQRASYKDVFNREYKDYLLLKDKMDRLQAEVSLLSNQLHSLPHNSSEVRDVKHKIRKKYLEMQQDSSYQDKKRLFNLHHKLQHIKKMVVSYDNSTRE